MINIEWKWERKALQGLYAALVCGIYKINKYYHIAGIPVTSDVIGRKSAYHVYFIAAEDLNWGQDVAKDCLDFKTINEAKAACEKHYHCFGNNPKRLDQIEVTA